MCVHSILARRCVQGLNAGMNTIWILAVAALAFGGTLKCKSVRKPWYDAWWKALCSAVGACFVALLFGLLPLTVAATAAATGAFLGLCWNPPGP